MKRPCIRNLPDFKKGCPERPWNGNTGEGCPAWIEANAVNRKGVREDYKMCLDEWLFKMLWDQCGLLEGNEQATQSFRNELCKRILPIEVPAIGGKAKLKMVGEGYGNTKTG